MPNSAIFAITFLGNNVVEMSRSGLKIRFRWFIQKMIVISIKLSLAKLTDHFRNSLSIRSESAIFSKIEINRYPRITARNNAKEKHVRSISEMVSA